MSSVAATPPSNSWKNYNMDWTLNTWKENSSSRWVTTLQKVSKCTLIPFLLIATFEILVKNFLVITTVKIITALGDLLSKPRQPTPLPPQRPPSPLPPTAQPETPAPSQPPPPPPEPDLVVPPTDQTASALERPPSVVSASNTSAAKDAPPSATSSPEPPLNPTLNQSRATVLGVGVSALAYGTAAFVGWPLLLGAGAAAVAGGALLHNADTVAPPGPARETACRTIFTRGRDKMYGALGALGNYLYENPK